MTLPDNNAVIWIEWIGAGVDIVAGRVDIAGFGRD